MSARIDKYGLSRISFRPLGWPCAFLLMFLMPKLSAQDDALEQELQFLRAEAQVITASRILENVRKSVASITLIEARDIHNMGARTIAEVLRLVPGVSYSKNAIGHIEMETRGIKSFGSEKVLFMLNSHPINDILLGTGFVLADNLPLENVKRIEIIRGPGSALYGANAFMSVINVLTYTSEEREGLHLSLEGGSFSTCRANLYLGGKTASGGYYLNANAFHTDGYEGFVASDAQSLNDLLHGTHASLAPGKTRSWEDRLDLAVGFQFKGLEIETRFMEKRGGPYIGIQMALNDESLLRNEGYYFDARYPRKLSPNLSIQPRLYRNFTIFNPYYQGFPAGYRGVFTQGTIADLQAKNDRIGTDIQFEYSLDPRRKLLFGLTGESQRQFGVTHKTNIGSMGQPLGGVMDLTGPTTNWNKNVDREFWAVYVENVWDIAKTLRFNVGSRYDRYSDFGGSFNPRIGLVYELDPSFDLKASMGKAFRAPTFVEQHTLNNVVAISDPNLKPDKVNSFELGANGKWERFQGSLTYFNSDISDLIVLSAPDENRVQYYRNVQGIRTKGLELESKIWIATGSYALLSLALQDAEHKQSGDQVADVPGKKGTLQFNFRLAKELNLNLNLYGQDSSPRATDDLRQDLAGYALWDGTLSWHPKSRFNGLELAFSIHNIGDKDYRYASPAPRLVPGDFPGEGRDLSLTLRYKR